MILISKDKYMGILLYNVERKLKIFFLILSVITMTFKDNHMDNHYENQEDINYGLEDKNNFEIDDDLLLEYNEDFIKKELDYSIKQNNNDIIEYLDDKIDCVRRVNNLRQVMSNNKVKKLEHQNKVLLERICQMELLMNNFIVNYSPSG